MNLLLDTHAFIWFVNGNSKLSSTVRSMIEDEGNIKAISIASCWEMSIKASLGRLQVSDPFDSFIEQQLDLNGFDLLDISLKHLSELIKLPYHHKDPFDRILVAQAKVDEMVILTNDGIIPDYDVKTIW